MKRDLSKVLMPNHPLYTEAVKALKLYHQAQAEGVVGAELERLKLMAEHRFQGDCQFFCVRADNGLPPGRPCFYQVGLINRSPYRIAN